MSKPAKTSFIEDIDKLLEPKDDQLCLFEDRVRAYTPTLLAGAGSWWEEDEWVLSYYSTYPDALSHTDPHLKSIHQFCGTLGWSKNPYIRDARGRQLIGYTYDRIVPCTISDLRIRRTGPSEFVFSIPLSGQHVTNHSHPSYDDGQQRYY